MTKTIFNNLIYQFDKIYHMNYVKSTYGNNFNSAGITFEHLLNKKEDSNAYPDYDGIEIKTTMRYSRYDIGLFSFGFDGPNIYESYDLTMQYALYYHNYRYLNVELPYHELVKINDFNYFELDIDEENNRLLINVYDSNQVLFEKRAFISFDALKQRIELKLKYLALVFVSKKVIDDDYNFRFYNLICYQYKDFETFIDLLKKKIITPTLMLKYFYNIDNNYYDNNHNKNFIFKIKKDAINELYTEVYNYHGK